MPTTPTAPPAVAPSVRKASPRRAKSAVPFGAAPVANPAKTPKGLRLNGSTTRDRAAHVLLRLHNNYECRHGLTVQQAMDEALRKPSSLSALDAALCTELVYGTLRAELRLQWMLNLHLRAPDRLPDVVRMVLLVAAYELVYLDRIPAHASVNWAVGTVRDTLGPGLAGVVNGVLRTVGRLGDAPRGAAFYTSDIADPLERLSVLYGVPLWIVTLWQAAYGEEQAAALAVASSQTPWPCVRVNLHKPDGAGLLNELREDGGLPIGRAGVLFEPGKAPDGMSELVRCGAASWQGAGSQLVLEALGAQHWDGPVWDACAGRGGKTCALLEMGVDVQLASDPHAPRLRSLKAELGRLELPLPRLLYGPTQKIDPGMVPQTIVLDAPCSGLGTLARRPDIRLQRVPAQLLAMQELQAQLIDAAWRHLPTGGRLAYITCAVNPAENEAQTARLLATCPEAQQQAAWQSPAESHGADMLYGVLLRKG